MASRAARAGETILLRARFLDDLGDEAQASGVYVHIYEPGIEDFDFLNATVVSGVATYLGQGVFEFPYTIPDTGPDGIWTDIWEGTLTGQDLDAQFVFEVTASGIIEQLPTQLFENNLINVYLASGIQALDGSELTEDQEFEFLTTTNPTYSSTRKVRLEIGSLIRGLGDDTLQMAILEASLEADALTWVTTGQNTELFEHARREYTTCLASKILLNNVVSGGGSGLLKSKTLADLSVTYDTDVFRDSMNRIQDCLNRWEPQVEAAGLAIASTQPQGVVKGEYDPDRIQPARVWQSTESGDVSRRMPVANTTVKPLGSRRNLKTWKPRW